MDGITPRDARVTQHVGQVIKLHRTKAKWSQDSLATSLQVSRSLISKIETGQACCSVDLLVQITQLLKIDPSLYFQIHTDSPYENTATGQAQLYKELKEVSVPADSNDAQQAILSILDNFQDEDARQIILQLAAKAVQEVA